MKKILYLLSALASLIYIAFYSANVSDIVARHMDTELIIPLVVAGFTLFTAMLIFFTSKKTALDKKMFFIPAMFLASAVITFFIGYYTPCEFCSL